MSHSSQLGKFVWIDREHPARAKRIGIARAILSPHRVRGNYYKPRARVVVRMSPHQYQSRAHFDLI